MNLAINKGALPVTGTEEFKSAVEGVLKGMNVSTAGIWEFEPEDRQPRKAEYPKVCHRQTGVSIPRESKNEGDEEVKRVNYTKEYLGPEEITHFGLEDDPFWDFDDHTEIWMSPQLKVVERQLIRTIKGRGIIAITGDYGMGKSTFLRHVLLKLRNDKSVRIIMPDRIERDKMTGGLLTEEIISQLGGDNKGKMPRSAGQRDKMAKRILESNMKANVYTVLVIDEAHDLKEHIFIALKRLWDSGMIFKMISIVLVGTGGKDEEGLVWGLRDTIEHNHFIREFAERCYMADLGKLNGSMIDYLDYRFRTVGRSVRDVFTGDALELLRHRVRTPQLCNNIAIRAMQNAYQDGKTTVEMEHVNDA